MLDAHSMEVNGGDRSEARDDGNAARTAVSDLPDSGNAGFIVHRMGQVRHEFSAEGLRFAREMSGYLTRKLAASISVMSFRELFGQVDRVHWIQHMRNPSDYAVLVDMSDHDSGFKDIYERDRLAEQNAGTGNWERIFVESTYAEHVMVPQHGLGERGENAAPHDGKDHRPPGYFAEPAYLQTTQPRATQLTTANAGVVIERTAHCKYAYREEGRWFAEDWATSVNELMAGRATVYCYEQTFGRQDRIHWLIHLRSLSDHAELASLARDHESHRQVLQARRIPMAKGGGGWGSTFVDGSIHDIVMTRIDDADA